MKRIYFRAIAACLVVLLPGWGEASTALRLDEQLEQAVLRALPAKEARRELDAPVEWRAAEETPTAVVEESVFLGQTMSVASVLSPDDLDIPVYHADRILIRMRVSGTDRVELRWKARGQFWKNSLFALPVEPDGAWRTYEVATLGLNGWQKTAVQDHVQQFQVRYPATASVALEFLDVRMVHEAYAREPLGVTHHRIGRGIKRALYLGANHAVDFTIAVPPDDAVFRASLAVMHPAKTILTAVARTVDGEPSVLFSRTIPNGSKWHDIQSDLSAFAGQTVKLTLRASSDHPTQVAFFGNPTVEGPAQANRPPNVLVYIVDCLRADHLDCYGYERETAPGVSAFAAEGVRFTHCFSMYSSTKASMTSMFTSASPWAHRCIVGSTPVPAGLRLLAEDFRAAGYETGAYIENLFVGTATNLERGYNHLEEVWQIRPQSSSGFANGFLRAHAARPFFLYVHTMEPHQFEKAFRPPERYRRLFVAAGKEPDDKALYDASIRFGDENFARVMAQLEQSGLKDNTIVVFSADHGEAFGEHGCYLHAHPPYNHQIHVPLIIRWPGTTPAGRVIETHVSLADIAPTLLDAAGLDANEQHQGLSLLPLLAEPAGPEFTERRLYALGGPNPTVMDKQYKLMRRDGAGGEFLLFDYRADHEELNNLRDEKPAVRAALAEVLDAYLREQERLRAALQRAEESGVASRIDAEQLEQLEALGYLE